jgi:hypothetical protein
MYSEFFEAIGKTDQAGNPLHYGEICKSNLVKLASQQNSHGTSA